MLAVSTSPLGDTSASTEYENSIGVEFCFRELECCQFLVTSNGAAGRGILWLRITFRLGLVVSVSEISVMLKGSLGDWFGL